MRKCTSLLSATGVLLLASTVRAAMAVPGTYATINVTGSASQFDLLPVAASNIANPAASELDPVTLKIANDSNYIYFYLEFSPSANPYTYGLYTAIDSDNSPSTGDNIYGSNQIGSNLGFVNDYSFGQTSSSFNDRTGGAQISSATADANSFGNIYLASPFDAATSYQIISLPLDLYEDDANGYQGNVFPSNEVTVEFYTSPNAAAGDTSPAITLGPVTYSIAAVPEPTSVGLLAGGGLLLLRRRRGA